MPKTRSDYPKAFRFREEDVALIAQLRERFAGPTGELCPEVDVLRAGLRALAREVGIGNGKKTKDKGR